MIEGETGGDARENEDDDDDDDFGVPPKHVRRVKSNPDDSESVFLFVSVSGEEEKRYARKVLEVTNTTKEDLLPCVVSNRQVLSRKELERSAERVVAVGFVSHGKGESELEGCEDGRRGEDDGDGEGEIVGIKSKRRREILRDCESKDRRGGRLCEEWGTRRRKRRGEVVSSYATLRDDCNRESRETGFTTVSRCAR